jgi:RimJ/RimL family protein N-acetyltransferase
MVFAMRDARPGEAFSDGIVALRPWTEADAPELVACVDGDAEIGLWLDQIPQPYTIGEALAYVDGLGKQSFAIVDAPTGRVLGSVGATWNEAGDVAEIGYWLRAGARGKGAATRALVLIARWAVTRGASRVQLRADTENAASRRVAEKAGFRLEGVLRSAHWNARLGRRVDWAMYSQLPCELP